MASKIYLIWAGEVSKKVAVQFKYFSENVFAPSLTSFMSETDIMAGELSVSTLMNELKECEFGIAFIYKDNARAPWVNFEIGALQCSTIAHGVSVLIIDNDQTSLAGTPLSDLQYKLFDKEGLWSILSRIVRAAQLDDNIETFKSRFGCYYSEFKKECDEIIKTNNSKPSQNTSSKKLEGSFEQILSELVSINNVLKLNYVEGLKEQIADLKRILSSMSEDSINTMKLSFRSQKYESAYKNFCSKINNLILKLYSNIKEKDSEEIRTVIGQLEKILEQTMNMCGE